MAMTESQKKYEKKRAKVCKTFAIKYTPMDILESNRLMQYLSDNKITANAYIKELIKKDLDSKKIPYPDNNLSDNL